MKKMRERVGQAIKILNMEVRAAMKRMKSGKAIDPDDIAVKV